MSTTNTLLFPSFLALTMVASQRAMPIFAILFAFPVALISLLPLWLAPGVFSQVSAPAEWNSILLSNNKSISMQCCQGSLQQLPNGVKFTCTPNPQFADPNKNCQDFGLSGCNSNMKVIGISYCAVNPYADPNQSLDEFKNVCKSKTGNPDLIQPRAGLCYFNNYGQPIGTFGNGYPPPNKDPPPPAKPPPPPDGAYNTALVDYSFTQALSCCAAPKQPLPNMDNVYQCSTMDLKIQDSFNAKCTKIITLIKAAAEQDAKMLAGAGFRKRDTTGTPGDDDPPDDITKQFCQKAYNNGMTYKYAYCPLAFDQAGLVDAPKRFQDDCVKQGGKVQEPKQGACLWSINVPAATQTGPLT